MPLKKSQGNMYDWVTHMHSHIGGKCPHGCAYCYVQTGRFGPGVRYSGEPRLIEKELECDYGEGRTIFIEHMQDMFAEGIKPEWVDAILEHCRKFPLNEYVFQTKNPLRALRYWGARAFPPKCMMGTTIETNRHYPAVMGNAPEPEKRYCGISAMAREAVRTFVTIEPIMDFDCDILLSWLVAINPSFVNIGADSKGCGLPEPTPEKVQELIRGLGEYGVTIRKKINLGRMLFATPAEKEKETKKPEGKEGE